MKLTSEDEQAIMELKNELRSLGKGERIIYRTAETISYYAYPYEFAAMELAMEEAEAGKVLLFQKHTGMCKGKLGVFHYIAEGR